jgi:hypothetical protein
MFIFSGLVLDIRLRNDVITDKSPVLTELCVTLEDILIRGSRGKEALYFFNFNLFCTCTGTCSHLEMFLLLML